MTRLLMFVGMTVGGYIGWWAGGAIGFGLMGTLMVSTIGSLIGVYVAWKVLANYSD
ncbi:MAG: hypothetical protein WCB27_15065 [Thermoguttaceae bacterium]